LGALSIPCPAVFRPGRSTDSEGKATGPPEDGHGRSHEVFSAIHHPDDYDPSIAEDEAMSRDIDALNDEMKAAGVRIFVCGLHPAKQREVAAAEPDGEVLVTDGPYLETKEHVGGLWVLEAADLDEALAWGRKAAVACRVPVEVRPFH
jgi:hypothetical protein